jgi:aminoacylase
MLASYLTKVLYESGVCVKGTDFLLFSVFICAGLASETDVYQVYNGDRSGIWIEFILRGNTGHGSRLIENTAGEKAQFLMNEMLAYRAREKQLLEDSQNAGKNLQLGNITTINLTIMSGGVQTNVVPDVFKVTFDCRVKPNGYDEFKEFLADVVRRTPKRSDDEVKIHYIQDGGNLLPTDIETPSWWLSAVKRTFDDLQCKQNWTIFPAGTDSRYLRNAGYPAIGFSPIIHTPILLHDHNEYLPQDVFLRGIGIYVKLIENLTSGSGVESN